MAAAPTDAEKRRRLPWSIVHGAANSVFSQLTFFGPVFVLFLDELGLPKTRIGLLLSFLPFSGLVALFIAPAVARAGVKRVFITFWGLRKLVTGFLLFTPWVLSRFGADWAFLYVAALVALFALCRAIAETAFFPWYQEIVPNSIRGQYSAIASVVGTVTGILALAVASYVMDKVEGLQGFMILLAAGVFFGIVCVLCAFPIPGGAPGQNARTAHLSQLRTAWADANFRRYLSGVGLVTLAFMGFSFVPLFMREQVGLDKGQVLLLQVGVYVGGMLSSYLWGWAADRYGSRPVVQSGLFLTALLPICWLLLPRFSTWSYPIALTIAGLAGIASFGWEVGNSRLLFVSVVPPERRTQYMALFYAWSGLLGGLGPLFGGMALDAFSGLQTPFLIFHLDPYTPLFTLSFLFLLGGHLLLGRLRADGAIPARTFAGLFVRGNPFTALASLVRYRLARDEKSRVQTTEDLGETRSPLNVEELLEALADPSFNVRYEAIVSIARTRLHPRLTAALVQTLDSSAADLSPAVAWALGRTGDPDAIPALRQALRSDYPLLRAHSARALGRLGDAASVPFLLDQLRAEADASLKVAYATALGQLRVAESAEDLLQFLKDSDEPILQGELALALARLLDAEDRFIRLWRRPLPDSGTALAQQLMHIIRLYKPSTPRQDRLLSLLEATAQDLSRNQFDPAARRLGRLPDHLPPECFPPLPALILRHCAAALTASGAERRENLILVLLALHAGFTGKQR